jgi:hypothetical protein
MGSVKGLEEKVIYIPCYIPWDLRAKMIRIKYSARYIWLSTLVDAIKYVYENHGYTSLYRYKPGQVYCHLIWEIEDEST